MTKEMEFKRALNRYDDRIEEINAEYERRFNNLSVNQYGETNAAELFELNAWSIQVRNEAHNDFIKEWAQISAPKESGVMTS